MGGFWRFANPGLRLVLPEIISETDLNVKPSCYYCCILGSLIMEIWISFVLHLWIDKLT